MAGWRDVEQGAPKIARLGLARLAEARVAMLVTGPTPAKVNSSCTDPRELRTAATRAWRSGHPEQAGRVLAGHRDGAVHRMDLEHGVMTTHHWSPRNGCHRSTRRYP